MKEKKRQKTISCERRTEVRKEVRTRKKCMYVRSGMGAWSACATAKWDSQLALFVSDVKELKETDDRKGGQRDERKVGERNISRKTV